MSLTINCLPLSSSNLLLFASSSFLITWQKDELVSQVFAQGSSSPSFKVPCKQCIADLTCSHWFAVTSRIKYNPFHSETIGDGDNEFNAERRRGSQWRGLRKVMMWADQHRVEVDFSLKALNILG